jgi:hypothetical protein
MQSETELFPTGVVKITIMIEAADLSMARKIDTIGIKSLPVIGQDVSERLTVLAAVAARLEGKMPHLIDLGWANGWGGRKPQLVVNCTLAGHKTEQFNRDASGRGHDNVVRCVLCGYEYHYDSSD